MAMNIVINNLFASAEDTYAPGEGDYIGEDGIWYCGKCHTPMQTRVIMLGEERTPFVPCRCRQEASFHRKGPHFASKRPLAYTADICLHSVDC